MKICNFYKPMLGLCMLFLFGMSGAFANSEHPLKNTNELEMLTCNGGSQIAYWSLDNCVSFGNDGSNFDYSELTASTNTPSGFASVNATNLTGEGAHSCVYGVSGAGFCHGGRINCGWVDNSSDAVSFTVTLNPSNGTNTTLTKLSFYQSAPLNYSHISGNTGDNDPPSHFGFRVLKNGQEIYQNTGNNTTHDWSLEEFDFSNDPDFTVSSTTTFKFELLGYCRTNGTSGLSVWELDEIKVFGCSETIDPCAGQGGDSDGDGVCNNQDCQPNNPNFPATPGMACNDGNPNTENDVVTGDGCNCQGTAIDPCAGQGGDSDGDGVCNNADCQPNNPAFPATPGMACNDGNPNTENDVVTGDGCGCAGTPIAPACDVTVNGCNITITGLSSSDYSKVFNANWQIVWECNPWINGGCNSTETVTVSNNGTYYVQACGTTETVIISGCTPVDPCAGQGGDSDGDGVCNNADCQPNNPVFPATPGTACNDGNPNTANDVVTADGCGCAGTPTGPACGVSVSGCNITITGLNSSDYTKVFDANWSIVWECNPWMNGGCDVTEVVTVPTNGTYYVQACGTTETVTISGCTPVDPCAGQGGDSDGDGVCNNADCQPNNPAFPAVPGTACNDGNSNTTNDVVTADGCGCAGTPTGPACGVSVSGCNITITGLTSNDYTKVFDANWLIVWECNPWSNGGCNVTEVVTVPNNGTYYVQACGTTETVTISGCTPVDPCAGQGGDSDGDGVCNNADCQPNNPAFPATPGTACNDGNPNTANDVVTADGCGCAGTPTGPACGVSVSGCNITITGLTSNDYTKVFDANWSIVWECNPWSNGGCDVTEVVTVPNNGTYYVQACGTTETVTISGCTPVDPCAGQGGDSDGDGVCNNADCQPNNPAFPAVPGTACNDGNPNTANDVVTADGCGCAGTPTGPTCDVSVDGCVITITGLTSNDYTKVFDTNWSIVWECNPWVNGGCNSTETISDLSNGTYYVQACGTTETITLSGCVPVDPCAGQGGDSDGDGVCNNADCQPNNPAFPATPGTSCNDGNPNTINDVVSADGCNCAGIVPDPCAGQGGDSDNDGVCDNQDCQPNNPAFPATPGTACNDGNPDTENDVISGDGCNCAGTPVAVCDPSRIAYWSLDACESFSSNGSNFDYSEFGASTSTPAGFSVVNASGLTHDGQHSCTEGESGYAICSSIRDNCNFQNNSSDAFKFSVTIRPDNSGTASLTKLTFFEAAPLTYSHISGNTGDNDPPSHYGIRILKNGQEVYKNTGNNTSAHWSKETFDLTSDPDFVVTSQTTFDFELLGYCRTTGTSGLAVWDLDEIEVFGCGADGYDPLEGIEGEDLFFNAVKDGRDVMLSWVTNTDYKNDYFEIERSIDGVNFEVLEEVVSISDSEEYMDYRNKDVNATTGVNYYRVKQIFNDGTFIYSNTREVAFDLDVNQFTIYPNPTAADVFVNLKDFVGNAGTISVYNSLGQMVYSEEMDVIPSEPVRISTTDMNSGVHAVSVQIDGKKTMTELLMVVKR